MCSACLRAYLINSAEAYAHANNLNATDIFNAFVDALGCLNDENPDFDDEFGDIEIVTVTVQ